MTQAELLAMQIQDTRDWTLKLIADLSGEDWGFQPAPGMSHALWTCGHLATSQHTLIHDRCLGAGVVDPEFKDRFPIGKSVTPVDGGAYPSVETVLDTMRDVCERTCAVVRGMSDELLAEPAYGAGGSTHPHYTDKRGAVSHVVRHEAFHDVQLAMIRRLLGKAFLR